jgi:thiol-disulfide isomerase/thioredoxin
MNRSLILGLVVVAAAAAGGYFVQRSMSDRGPLTPAAVSSVPGAGANAPASSDPHAAHDEPTPEEPKRTIPESIPAVSLADRAGKMRSLSEWKGQPVIVNFWATWCVPCREEIPLLQSLRKERAADRLEIVGIAIDEREAVLKYAADMSIDYPILIGEQDGYEAAEAFGVALVLPFSVFADSQGRIVTLKIGELHADEAAFILDRVRDVDANQLPLDSARQQIADKLRDLAGERARKDAEG